MYNSLKAPITNYSQMPVPVVCTPIARDWKETISHQWWGTCATPNPKNEKEAAAMKKMFLLRDRLLSFGGEEVCLPLVDPDYDAVMERGQFFYGKNIRMRKGRACQCHRNAAYLWKDSNKSMQICTGYALSSDGMWRQHTWLMQPLERRWQIIETTVRRLAYFGAILTNQESERFLEYA